MGDHTWIVEEVDGGPIGTCDFWRCSVCGAGGGPAGFSRSVNPWPPFIPGAGKSKQLSGNCDEAVIEVRAYVRDLVRSLGQKSSKGVSPKYAEILKAALNTPGKTDFMLIREIASEVDDFRRRPSMSEVFQRLIEAGFNAVPEKETAPSPTVWDRLLKEPDDG